MKNSFNILLVTLGFIDAFFLLGGILESIRKEFQLGTDAHNILFVSVFYSLNKIAMTASIFMTMAISLERNVAVYYPLDFNMVSTNCKKAFVEFFLRTLGFINSYIVHDKIKLY